MSYHRTFNKIDRSNGKRPQAGSLHASERLGERMGRQATTAEAPKSPALNHKQFIWPYNHTPTFSGAKYWVDRHQKDFRTFAHLLELYPHLLRSEGLNPIREYMIPPESLPSNYTTSDSSDISNHGNAELHTHGNSTTSKRFVYICDNISESDFGVSSTKDKLVAALSSYCCVRTSPEQLGSFIECVDIVDVITAADAFVFLMNSRTLNSWFSLHQLGLAIAYDIPVIAVREAGFKLPPVFPVEFHHLEIVKPGAPLPVPPTLPRASPNPERCKSSDARRRQGTTAKDVNYHNDFFSDSELLKRSKRGENQPPLLATVISELYRTSLLYVWHLHDSCIAKLFGRLSDFLGDSFLDLEISQAHNSADTSDNKLNVGRTSKQLIVGATSPFRPLPSQLQQLSVSDLPVDRDSRTPRLTPVRKEQGESTTASNKSRTNPASPAEQSLRLPPIPTIIGVAISPSPSRSVSRSSIKSPGASSVRSPSRRSFSRSPKSHSLSSMGSSPPMKVAADRLPDTYMQLSPPSSPFIQTNYIVFPSDSMGPKKPPYMVCFPDDVFNEEENQRRLLDEDSEDSEEVQIPEENDTNFNHVRLDVSGDQVLSNRSPYSSPTLQRKTAVSDKVKSTPDKTERKTTSENKASISDRGPQKSKVKEPSFTQTRNADKKTMKVSRVVLKYSADGKPST